MVVLAAVDWAIALALLLTQTDTPVAAPLLVLVRRDDHAADSPGGSSGQGRPARPREWSPRVARLVLREPRLLWSAVLLVRRDGVPPVTGLGRGSTAPERPGRHKVVTRAG